jgi:hypothetical protein
MCVCVFVFWLLFLFLSFQPRDFFHVISRCRGSSRKEDRLRTGGPRAHFFFNPLDSRAPPSPLPFLSLSLSLYRSSFRAYIFAARCVLIENPDWWLGNRHAGRRKYLILLLLFYLRYKLKNYYLSIQVINLALLLLLIHLHSPPKRRLQSSNHLLILFYLLQVLYDAWYFTGSDGIMGSGRRPSSSRCALWVKLCASKISNCTRTYLFRRERRRRRRDAFNVASKLGHEDEEV